MTEQPTVSTPTSTPTTTTESSGLSGLLSKMAKTFGVNVPSSDIDTLISLATPLVSRVLTPSSSSSTSSSSSSSSTASIQECPTECKPLDDGECLDEASVLDLISKVKKGEIDKDDAFITLRTELKRQYKRQSILQKEVDELWGQINTEKVAISRAMSRMSEYREKTPMNDDSRFDQYLVDLRTVTQLRKSVQQKEFRAYRDTNKIEPSPSIARLEEAIVSLL